MTEFFICWLHGDGNQVAYGRAFATRELAEIMCSELFPDKNGRKLRWTEHVHIVERPIDDTIKPEFPK